MKITGIIAIVVSLLLMFGGLEMDTTVTTDSGLRVHNIGKLQEQRNTLNIGMFVAALGILLIVVGRKKKTAPDNQHDGTADILRNCPFCAEKIKVEAIKCKNCGSDVPPPMTDEELMRHHGITFERGLYRHNGSGFDTLSGAVAEAESGK